MNRYKYRVNELIFNITPEAHKYLDVSMGDPKRASNLRLLWWLIRKTGIDWEVLNDDPVWRQTRSLQKRVRKLLRPVDK
jgi:hypothetical protein